MLFHWPVATTLHSPSGLQSNKEPLSRTFLGHNHVRVPSLTTTDANGTKTLG